MDSTRRSLTKTLTWRIFALFITIIISLILTGTWEISIAIGITTNIVKTLFFFLHERLWERIKWEKK
ncbi:MAG: DUF2061 domain-containing protein [Candidatus Lokiarchaeota archaeon]|nr:DUF2061 domain-containing protein [Candidatus Lokiarchaeota archaeon]